MAWARIVRGRVGIDIDRGRHRRRPLRLAGYDYAQAGAYFVTVVVHDRLCLFGEVVDEEMRLNAAGVMAGRVWETLPGRYPSLGLDAFVVMPNHIHGILMIDPPVGASLVGAHRATEPDEPSGATTSQRAAARGAATADRYALGDVVGAYKSLTTVAYGRGVKGLGWTRFSGRLWQRNYYEHVVRNDESLQRIRQYVHDNPVRWSFDRENPQAVRPQDL